MPNQEEIKDMQSAFAVFKEANDALQAEVKALGTGSGELTAKVDKMNTVLDSLEGKIDARQDKDEADTARQELLTTAEKAYKDIRDEVAASNVTLQGKFKAEMDDIKAMLTRRGVASEGDEKAADLVRRKQAFFGALRHNPRGNKSLEEYLSPDVFKALTVSDDTTGGYLAPVEYVMEILTDVLEFSPIRALARIRTTSRTEIQIPKRTTRSSASWVQEVGTRTETTNPAWGMERMPVDEMFGMTKISKQDLEDSAFDLEAFVREEVSEQFGVLEGTAFCAGTGQGQPEGILTHASVANVISGHATQITADGMIELYYALKEPYVPNATFVMQRATIKEIRKLKDAQGQYLWMPSLKTEAEPATILDRPYASAPDMPAIGNNLYPVVFGDFRRGYLIVDRIVMEMMTDPYTSKATGMVEFSARRRVGGGVVQAEALKKLKISAT